MLMNSAIMRCGALPSPAEAYCNCPGRALMNAISSFTFLAGNDGCETSRLGTMTTSETGAKSRSRSYDTFFIK